MTPDWSNPKATAHTPRLVERLVEEVAPALEASGSTDLMDIVTAAAARLHDYHTADPGTTVVPHENAAIEMAYGDSSTEFKVTTRGPSWSIKSYCNGRPLDDVVDEVTEAAKRLDSLADEYTDEEDT